MIENNIMDFIICALLGFITWFFGGIDGLLQVLIAFSVIDYITGIIAACLNHELSSRVGFRGIVKKVILFMFVGMAHLLDLYLPGDSGSIRAVVCLFYVVNEGISIIENAEKIGVPIPKPLHNMLAKLHDMTQLDGEVSKPESNMTESDGESVNSDDNCEKMTVYNTYTHSKQESAPPGKVKESKHDKAK
ncbi:MAG: phage holin family protein [Synergistaceae bacterium]|nr:phage holin family protein [Synergistaceae bacterium]